MGQDPTSIWTTPGGDPDGNTLSLTQFTPAL